MMPARAVVVERLVLVTGFVAMVIAIGAFDWRAGLLFGGFLLTLSALDLPGRRP